jgi:GntR family transcriptional regulator/MocR family aminotransferase
MVFTLHTESTLPLYRQICEGVRQEIARGSVAAGARLPSSRQLAMDLGVSRITVANAYAELEADGVVEVRPGAGTFVLPPWPEAAVGMGASGDAAPPLWQAALGAQVNPIRDRMLRQVLRGPILDDTISFAWGAGDPRLVPTDAFRHVLTGVLDRDGAAALGPEHSDGYPPLRRALAQYVRQLGIVAGPDEIVVTAGTQQAITMLAGALLRPGDGVVVESPTWPGALEAFEARQADVIGVPLDRDGMRADLLQRVLEARRPRLIYTVPTFQNPTGIVMSATRRREIVTLAHRYGVPILEDDHVREVRFGSPIPPPLAAFDRYGDVIHASSFTKSFIPALRLGYIVARGPLREALTALRRSADLFSSSLMQRALCAYLESGAMQRHWKYISRVYRRRHAAMMTALKRSFPPGITWTGVEGGLVVWVNVPPHLSVIALFEDALRAGVSFVAGAAFFPAPNDQPSLRLNFAAVDERQIERGIAILGQLLRQHLAARSLAARATVRGDPEPAPR